MRNYGSVDELQKMLKAQHTSFEPTTLYLQASFLTNCAMLLIQNKKSIESTWRRASICLFKNTNNLEINYYIFK